jgi:predicted CXXCH cytochrome family protein
MVTRSGLGAAVAAALLLLGSARAGAAGWPGARGARVRASSDPYEECGLAKADRARTPSTACLSCHDGTATPTLAFANRHGGPGGGAHPVDTDYFAASMGNRRLAQPFDLPRAVVLVDGRVACTSCHDGMSTNAARVAGELVSLCTSCHVM